MEDVRKFQRPVMKNRPVPRREVKMLENAKAQHMKVGLHPQPNPVSCKETVEEGWCQWPNQPW